MAGTPTPEITLKDLLTPAWAERKRILIISVIAAVVVLVINLLLPNYYKAGAVILPETDKNKLGMMSQLAGIASLCVSYLGVWMRMINDPVQRTGADFIHFYSAGIIAQRYGAEHVYDITLQHDVEQELVGFALAERQVLPYNHLPFLIPLLQVVVNSDYVASFYRWIAIMIAVHAAAILILGKVLEGAGLPSDSVRIVQIGSLLFLPLFVSLLNGQDTALLFLGAALWLYGFATGKEMVAGIGLGLATVRPHIAVLMAIPMLFSYSKVFAGFLISAGILAIVSISIIGIQGTREFIDLILLTAGGDWHGMNQDAMFNLLGLLLRIFRGLDPNTLRGVSWVMYAVAIPSLCVVWFRSRDRAMQPPIGVTVILALLFAPHLHFHDLTLLLIPIYELLRTGGLKAPAATLTPIAVSLLLLVSNASPYLQYTMPYLLMAAWVIYMYLPGFREKFTTLHRS